MTSPPSEVCPRCGREHHATYWGPCAACREEMATVIRTDARVVDVAAYEPKMNVVPNQVATKD